MSEVKIYCEKSGNHNIFQVGAGRDFIVFNDGDLSMEPINDDDIQVATTKPGFWCESAAWSANCEWYFIVVDEGILLFNVYSREGLFCRKKSARFIEAYVETKHLKPRRRKPKQGTLFAEAKSKPNP